MSKLLSYLAVGVLSFSVIFQSQASGSVDVPWFVPATKFVYQVKPSVMFMKQTNSFVYTYHLKNDKKSEQGIALFGFVNHALTKENEKGPTGWWVFKRIDDDVIFWHIIEAEQIMPGKEKNGFSVDCQLLPMLDFVYAQTDLIEQMDKVKPPTPPSQEQLDELYRRNIFPNNLNKKISLIPGPKVTNMSNSDIVRHLRNQRDKAVSLGLISNAVQISRIDTLLQQIEVAFQRNDIQALRLGLKTFAGEIRGKKTIDVAARVTFLTIGHYLKFRLRTSSPPDTDSDISDDRDFDTENEND